MRNVRFMLLGVVALVIGLSVYYITEGVRKFNLADDFRKELASGISLNQLHLVEKISAEDELELTAVRAEVDQENDKNQNGKWERFPCKAASKQKKDSGRSIPGSPSGSGRFLG